jgi:hypothetical protein
MILRVGEEERRGEEMSGDGDGDEWRTRKEI